MWYNKNKMEEILVDWDIGIEKELETIKGGTSFSVWTGIIVSTIVIFVSGLIEGITNPSKCGDINGYN